MGPFLATIELHNGALFRNSRAVEKGAPLGSSMIDGKQSERERKCMTCGNCISVYLKQFACEKARQTPQDLSHVLFIGI
eukprot:g18309.t1